MKIKSLLFEKYAFTAAAVFLVAVLAGCVQAKDAAEVDSTVTSDSAQETKQETDQSAEASPEPKPEPEPEPESDPAPKEARLEFPECVEVFPPEEVVEAAPDFAPEPWVTTELTWLDRMPGPAARTAVQQATNTLECMWGVPNSDRLIMLWIAELPDEVRDTLIGELRDSNFVEGEQDGMITFNLKGEPTLIGDYFWYGFRDSVMAFTITGEEHPGLFTKLNDLAK